MRVFLRPTGLFSRAMERVAYALAAHAPGSVKIVPEPWQADVVVSHVIGAGDVPGQEEVVIQYCLKSAGNTVDEWSKRWRRARLTWSYFDLFELSGREDFNFYHAPLGVDPVFVGGQDSPRDINVMTSGYVSHLCGEAIEEMAIAADAVGLRVLHLGPQSVEGMRVTPPRWTSVLGISDVELAALYHRTEWVSGLRHIEGFELPILEGLCCGARPIVFDRPDMTQWYEDHAAFVPECSGPELVEVLTDVLRHVPVPVSASERAEVARKFDWGVIARGFWERVGV